ncbi:ImmA/IrrE family metallo-endopeptidase [[Clostridium] innocuum]|uniref:ImmA/IrrE family metallo-endopeptidase n=1 Tax=Clostridium innocuum TaxID=1522 RepID=UPI000D78FF66|nr:ImmA/IrrE family metallo-endopeptidase [[Clostridium] innocuum]MCR0315854.1 ImmA/IrrE family metallo-endopeptidase [[Clostridium] innocuum]MCR0370945.1 ImmA/IrrE family metallo-endopeptidase [[Clostridium] innocuum]MCR0375601.1 ImmA/IrrE family metallo-endopeptidase [[Clostridium] innocuum]MCR0560921.1 ImmA/IrrE family metallo-endopeptidase [[Clostridium] innocuum]MCR0603695.1 ImmA/IrrE family metallo-endopeptidase [[Clostridium] innocuum]
MSNSRIREEYVRRVFAKKVIYMCEFIKVIRKGFVELSEEEKNSTQRIEEIANEILIYFQQASYPIDIQHIALKTGFDIYQGPIQNPEESAKLIIDETLDVIINNGKYIGDKIIIVNDKDTVYHQNFAIAHVLGKYIFEYPDNDYPYYCSYITNTDYSDAEARANRFAAALLMPKDIFETQYDFLKKNNGTIYDIYNKLSDMFCVSPEAVRRRFPELNIKV